MIKFLKRYLHLRGDFSDEKRSKEFENKVNSLMTNSLKFFLIHLSIFRDYLKSSLCIKCIQMICQ